MASTPVSPARHRRPPSGRFRALSWALLAIGPLWAWGLAAAQTSPAELPPTRAPLVPPAELGGGGVMPQPQRPDAAALKPQPPARFEASLDALVRDGVVSPAERAQLRNGSAPLPFDLSKQQQACRSGALSAQECRTGLVLRWHGRKGAGGVNANGNADGDIAGGERLGADGRPLPPLTVPVSALLAGSGGSFRLADVFSVTPRPAPIVGNGNRSLLFPLIGEAVVSSGFGYRLHPLLGDWLMHSGRDLAAPEGTPVVAALAGRVLSSGLAGGYGLAIEIEHERPRRRSLYGHLSELYVTAGQKVRQGEVIGRVGSTGLSSGPHLHFELRLPEATGWVAVDPGDLDPGKGAIGSDAVALLIGQLLQRLERPAAAKGAANS